MSVDFSWDGPLLRLDLIGTTAPEEVIRQFKVALEDPRATEKVALLLDTARSDSMATRTSNEIRLVAEALKPYVKRVQGRCAVIAAKDVHFGLSRMGSVYSELIGVDAGVFRTEAEAIGWLRSSSQKEEEHMPSEPQASAVADDVKGIVANLDTTYQKAVKEGDVAMMDCILADEMVLVTGRGRIFTKEDLLEEARSGRLQYERQEELEQRVRVWGQTAVVTALLWAKGTDDGKPFEYKLWFSDTYVRTPAGWRYAFGQSSIPLPKEG